MQQGAQQVRDVDGQVQGALQSLLSKLEPMQSAWQGTAATSFHTLIERFQTDMGKLHTALEGIADQIQSSGQTYAQQEEEHSSTMSKITSSLG
jgi:WXG100 family type VII secretion target